MNNLSYFTPDDRTMVVGGTPTGFSNRMREVSMSLLPVSKKVCAKYQFTDCASLEEVAIMLQEMIHLEYNLVGTRGYVYDSRGMLIELQRVIKIAEENKWEEPIRFSWNLFTRAHGLREAIVGTLLRMSKDKGVYLGGK
jgi:hypothetical protein